MKNSSNTKPETQPVAPQAVMKRPLWVSIICITMWISAPVASLFAFLEVRTGIIWTGAFFGTMAIFMIIVGIDFWRMRVRKWNVMLLALLTGAGYVVRLSIHPDIELKDNILNILFDIIGILTAYILVILVLFIWKNMKSR
ncbi:MAG: hypothetical protein SXV54_16950 [Chloroflexota bacterium]|nr:hypothetical protein [Chloroflexota bacterium]